MTIEVILLLQLLVTHGCRLKLSAMFGFACTSCSSVEEVVLHGKLKHVAAEAAPQQQPDGTASRRLS